MSIQTAVMALSPLIYWTLGESSGNVAHDLSGNGYDGTISGDVGAYVGPEIGTTGLRLFSGGMVVRQLPTAWDFASPWTVMAWASTQANGAVSTIFPFINMGDVSNRTARGWYLYETHPTLQVPTFIGRGTVNPGLSMAPAEPKMFWHHITFSYNPITKIYIQWMDGVKQQATVAGTPGVPLPIDSLVVKLDENVVVSHVAVIQSQLTDLQVQSVSQQQAAWPYTIPINTPIQQQTTTVDLTPVLTQTTQIINNQGTYMPQITEIATDTDTLIPLAQQTQTDTHNIVNTLFPQLAGFLNTIMNGITTTIGTGVDAVTRTLGQWFSGSPLDQWTPEDLGTVCHPSVIDVTLGPAIRYGLQLQCTSFADWYTFTGFANDYTIESLGTLQIFRGGSEVYRRGLHSLTHSVMPLPGVPVIPVNVGLEFVPPDYRVVLTPSPETCWHLESLVQP